MSTPRILRLREVGHIIWPDADVSIQGGFIAIQNSAAWLD